MMLILILSGLHPMRVWGDPEKGPLHASNRFPPHLMFLTPPGNRPHLIPPGQVKLGLSIDYTSIFFNEKNDNGHVLIDMEMTMTEFSLCYGISDHMSFQAIFPFINMSDGFLDGFLDDFHNTLGLSNYGRQYRPEDEFAYLIQTDTRRPWFTPQTGGMYLTDSTLAFNMRLFERPDSNPTSCSLIYNLKLPTGSTKHGFGSGGFDHGLSLLFRFHLGPVALFVNPSWIYLSTSDIDVYPKINQSNIHGLLIGGEYAMGRSWTFIGQVNYYTSPIAHKSIPPLRDNSMQLTLGTSYKLASGMDWGFIFSEDLSDSVPDFTIGTRLSYNFKLM